MRNNDVVVGQIRGVFGCDGCVRVMSFTDPPQSIGRFEWWLIGSDKRAYRLIETKRGSPGIIARIEGVDDRNQASLLMNQEIAVKREWLEELPDGTYYWFDLIGLCVINQSGERLGTVKKLIETGANDVLVVKNDKHQCLIPYLKDRVIKKVDIQNRQMTVDWQKEWCDES